MTLRVPLDVSRETQERLDCFEAELSRWNKTINLVSSESLKDGFVRHIVDSAQLLHLTPSHVNVWADIGSGGGLPGLIVGILASEGALIDKLVFVESDTRKCAFLRETARKLGLSVEIKNDRIEMVPPLLANVVSARALAPLPKLLEYTERHLSPGGLALFLKGARHMEEIAEAKKTWSFDVSAFPSKTDVSAAVLAITNIKRCI